MKGNTKIARIDQKSFFFHFFVFVNKNTGYQETKNTNFWKGIALKYFGWNVDCFPNKSQYQHWKILDMDRKLKLCLELNYENVFVNGHLPTWKCISWTCKRKFDEKERIRYSTIIRICFLMNRRKQLKFACGCSCSL